MQVNEPLRLRGGAGIARALTRVYWPAVLGGGLAAGGAVTALGVGGRLEVLLTLFGTVAAAILYGCTLEAAAKNGSLNAFSYGAQMGFAGAFLGILFVLPTSVLHALVGTGRGEPDIWAMLVGGTLGVAACCLFAAVKGASYFADRPDA